MQRSQKLISLLALLLCFNIATMQQPNSQDYLQQYREAQLLFHYPKESSDYTKAVTAFLALTTECPDPLLKAKSHIALGQMYFHGIYLPVPHDPIVAEEHFYKGLMQVNSNPNYSFYRCQASLYLAHIALESNDISKSSEFIQYALNVYGGLSAEQQKILEPHLNYNHSIGFLKNHNHHMATMILQTLLKSPYAQVPICNRALNYFLQYQAQRSAGHYERSETD